MDKVLSARVDDSILNKISILSRELHTSKKNVIESAINLFAKKVEQELNVDVFDLTCGSWQRSESTDETVQAARKAFRNSMTRHHQ